jgi:hypothetical protein
VKSKKWSLNLYDVVKGAIMSGVGAAGAIVVNAFATGGIPSDGDLKKSGAIGVSVGLGYLLKNLFENSEGKLTKAEPKK